MRQRRSAAGSRSGLARVAWPGGAGVAVFPSDPRSTGACGSLSVTPRTRAGPAKRLIPKLKGRPAGPAGAGGSCSSLASSKAPWAGATRVLLAAEGRARCRRCCRTRGKRCLLEKSSGRLRAAWPPGDRRRSGAGACRVGGCRRAGTALCRSSKAVMQTAANMPVARCGAHGLATSNRSACRGAPDWFCRTGAHGRERLGRSSTCAELRAEGGPPWYVLARGSHLPPRPSAGMLLTAQPGALMRRDLNSPPSKRE